jgi:hypoxanthine phosphoribosyltransferase
MAGIPCEYISWNQYYTLCGELHQRIRDSAFRPDMIVAIARGGYMPGRVLADFFDLMNLAAMKIEHYDRLHKQAEAVVVHPLTADINGKRVLLVDDVSDSGDTFEVALQHLQSQGTPAELRTAVLHHKSTSSYVPDYYARRIVKWRWISYPWAIVEDLTSLLSKATRWPASEAQAAEYLAVEHGLHLPKRIMHEVWGKLVPATE